MELARFYDGVARKYDGWGALTERKAKQRLLALAAPANGERVLDVGVGTAMLFAEVVARNQAGDNVGLDISPGMLAVAEETLSARGLAAYSLQRTDGERLAPGPFSLVLSTYVLELVAREDYPRFIARLAGVCAARARVVLAGMIEGPGLWRWHARRMVRSHPAWQGGFRADEASAALRAHGFTVTHREVVSQLGFQTALLRAER